MQTGNCQWEVDGKTSLARDRFDAVVKSEAKLSQLISESSGFPGTPTLSQSPLCCPFQESVRGLQEQGKSLSIISGPYVSLIPVPVYA